MSEEYVTICLVISCTRECAIANRQTFTEYTMLRWTANLQCFCGLIS